MKFANFKFILFAIILFTILEAHYGQVVPIDPIDPILPILPIDPIDPIEAIIQLNASFANGSEFIIRPCANLRPILLGPITTDGCYTLCCYERCREINPWVIDFVVIKYFCTIIFLN